MKTLSFYFGTTLFWVITKLTEDCGYNETKCENVKALIILEGIALSQLNT